MKSGRARRAGQPAEALRVHRGFRAAKAAGQAARRADRRAAAAEGGARRGGGGGAGETGADGHGGAERRLIV